MADTELNNALIFALARCAVWAHLPPSLFQGKEGLIHDAINSGNTRTLEYALREICPEKMWEWPGYFEYSMRVGERPTRIRMVSALANKILRDDHWIRRIPQMLQISSRLPLWKFQSVGDSRDPPECMALTGKIERFDSTFWQQHSPANCQRVGCRCSIRTYHSATDDF